MAAISISNDDPIYSFRADDEPRATARSGDSIRFRTSDATYANLTGQDIDRGRVNFQKANALCGPVYVEGARPGDAIGVQIESITVGDRAFVVYVARWRSPMFGLLESKVIQIEVRDGLALLPRGGRMAVRPMIGCIGVAPAAGFVSSLSPTARTGGNMDLVELSEGATIWLPVEVEGALLSLGDLHVRMGRGEPVGSGLECGGEVVGKIHVAADKSISGSIVCDPTRINFVGTGEGGAEAERVAVHAAWEWLTRDCAIESDAGLAISAALLELNHGGPAGANVVAGFDIGELTQAGVSTNVWPLC